MDRTLFSIKQLKHIYEKRTVLDIPSLSFAPGKIHAVTGPNGSGKTTLCSMLALLLKPTSGKLFYRGKPCNGNSGRVDEWRKQITMVHQNPFLFHTTVEKNVAYGLRMRKKPRAQWKTKARECLELMGIDHLRRQQAGKLSGGETQRVAVARALAVDPEVLILDEFTANVDKNYVKIMEQVILDIFKQRNVTIFVVTHDDSQAMRIAHTRTHLVNGEVLEHGVFSSESS